MERTFTVVIEVGGNAAAEEDQQEMLVEKIVKRIEEQNAMIGGSTARVTSVTEVVEG
jgi:hypothetical protein